MKDKLVNKGETVMTKERTMQLLNKENRYFHVTPMENVASILNSNLPPKIGERSEKAEESEKAIFLFSDVQELENALYNWLGQEFEDDPRELAILQIDLPADFPVVHDIDSNGVPFFESYCFCDIPMEYITGIYDETYEPIYEEELSAEIEL